MLDFGGAAFFSRSFLSESSIYAVSTAEIGSILPLLLKKRACRRNSGKNNAISTFHTGVINGFVLRGQLAAAKKKGLKDGHFEKRNAEKQHARQGVLLVSGGLNAHKNGV